MSLSKTALACVPNAIDAVPMAMLSAPIATASAPRARALRPTATAAVAPVATADCPPIAIPSAAAACAPLVALLPMAMAPAADAVVEFATLSGVVPSPPEPPMATVFNAEALLPKPMAMLDMPPAEASSP
jgi:hypothetical protein